MSAPDPLPTLVAERMKIWHSNDGDSSNPAISDDERDRRTERVCAQVNVLENRIADMVAPSVDGVLAQFELLMELVELGGWADERDKRLIESIKGGLRQLMEGNRKTVVAANRKTVIPFPYGHMKGPDTRDEVQRRGARWDALVRARKSLQAQERRALRRYQAAIAESVGEWRDTGGDA